MSETKDKPSWLEQIENANADELDTLRSQIPEGAARTYFDLQVGTAKGIYYFEKGMVEGLIDLGKAGWKLATDPETQKKAIDRAVGIVEDCAKLQYGSMEQKKEVLQRLGNKADQITQAVKQQFQNEWEEAKRNGKEAEVIAQWGAQGILEIGSMFLGLGELKAAATPPKAAAAIAKVEEKVAQAGKLAKAGETASDLSQKAGKVIEECPLPKIQPELKVEVARGAREAEKKITTNFPTQGRKYNQITRRGWSQDTIDELVNNPYTTREAVNKATGNKATAYFRRDGHYVVRDDVTGNIVQMSDTKISVGNGSGQWRPDDSIRNPYIP